MDIRKFFSVEVTKKAKKRRVTEVSSSEDERNESDKELESPEVHPKTKSSSVIFTNANSNNQAGSSLTASCSFDNRNPDNDIGNFVGTAITAAQRTEMLHRCWAPSSSYDFNEDGKNLKRKFRYEWLQLYSPWLQYSKKLKGPLCLYCVLFPPKNVQGVLGALIVTPFLKYKDMHGQCRNHVASHWHKQATLAAKAYTKDVPVTLQLDSAHEKLIAENKKVLLSIISTVVFCGTHDLPLRGKTLDSGVFFDLIQFKIDAGDEALQKHIQEKKKNATYMSPQIQNEIIVICGNVMQTKIVEDLRKAQAFCILADESADISGKEQLSIGVRFFDEGEMKIREEFLGFVEIDQMDAKTIADKIGKFFDALAIDPEKCVGQGYDGCSTMAGKDGGVQKILREKFSKALYFHCASHKLNLVVNDLNSVTEVRNTVSTIKDIINFFRESVIRRKYAPNIPLLCETRWSQKYKSISAFKQKFVAIIEGLQKLSEEEGNTATRKSAFQLHSAATKSVFLFCVCLIAKYSALLEPVVNILQSKTLDLVKCALHIRRIRSIITEHRNAAEVQSKELVDEATGIGEALGVELQMPRIVGKQQYRSNPSATSIAEYFRRSIFIPYLDSFINSLENRFSDDQSPAFALQSLHPYRMDNFQDLKVVTSDIAAFYNMPNLPLEVELWFRSWRDKNLEKEDLKELDLIDILKEADPFFPEMKKALLICLAQPCTTATIERTFSSLRRVKTWLRSTMAQDRLNGLCMLSVHRELVQHDKLFVEKVLSRFSEDKRKLCLV